MLSKFFDIEDDGFNFDKERRKFIDNLNFLKAMSVQESTLYKKWQELNQDLYIINANRLDNNHLIDVSINIISENNTKNDNNTN